MVNSVGISFGRMNIYFFPKLALTTVAQRFAVSQNYWCRLTWLWNPIVPIETNADKLWGFIWGVGCQIQPDGLDKEHGANDECHKKAKPLAIPDDLKPGGTHGIYRLTP